MSKAPTPTESERFWLDHEAAIAASNGTTKEYAAEQSLSLQAIYQARKRLRMRGLLPPARSGARTRDRAEKPAPKPIAFSKVELTSPHPMPVGFRLSLPNGLVLEWSGGELPSAVVELVERWAAAPR